jgi:hypothetical protein
MMIPEAEDVLARGHVHLLPIEETAMMAVSVTIDVVAETMTVRDHTALLAVEDTAHRLGSVGAAAAHTHIRTESGIVTLK